MATKRKPTKPADFDATNRLRMFMHCKLCLAEIKAGHPDTIDQSPESYARLSVGFTGPGLQVWCVRHDANVVHIWFEGQQHPAILDRLPNKQEVQ